MNWWWLPLLVAVSAAGACALVIVRRRRHARALLEMERKQAKEAKRTRERWEQAVAKLREGSQLDSGDGHEDKRSR